MKGQLTLLGYISYTLKEKDGKVDVVYLNEQTLHMSAFIPSYTVLLLHVLDISNLFLIMI